MNDARGVSDPQSRAPVRRAAMHEARVDHQPAFVLHSYAWRETSLIVETLSRDFGRMALVARGAKRPTSQFRGILMPFSPLALSWSGRLLATLARGGTEVGEWIPIARSVDQRQQLVTAAQLIDLVDDQHHVAGAFG